MPVLNLSAHPSPWNPSFVAQSSEALISSESFQIPHQQSRSDPFFPPPALNMRAEHCKQDYPQHERQRLAGKSRLEPPKFGSSERQEVAAAIHKRMLAANPEVEQKPFLKVDCSCLDSGLQHCQSALFTAVHHFRYLLNECYVCNF